jgi:thiol-disulfide isomerase/thioredoxin
MKFKGILICTLFLLLTCGFSAMAQKAGSVLPEFKFVKMDGTAFTKSQIKPQEKSILIYFDPTCEHCQKEAEEIGKRYLDFKNVSFYLVSTAPKAEINMFMQTYGKKINGKKNVMTFLDPNHEFMIKFAPTQYPAIYVYSQGKLVKYFSGTTNVNEILAATK